MYKKLGYLLFLLVSITTSAQQITGKVYDSKSVLKNIKVSNITKQSAVYSDDDGIFEIVYCFPGKCNNESGSGLSLRVKINLDENYVNNLIEI